MSVSESAPLGTIAHLKRVKQERDALAAHVERLREDVYDQANTILGELGVRETIDDYLPDSYNDTPATSLARRDLLRQAEALEEMSSIVNPDNPGRSLVDEAKRLRQQAKEID